MISMNIRYIVAVHARCHEAGAGVSATTGAEATFETGLTDA